MSWTFAASHSCTYVMALALPIQYSWLIFLSEAAQGLSSVCKSVCWVNNLIYMSAIYAYSNQQFLPVLFCIVWNHVISNRSVPKRTNTEFCDDCSSVLLPHIHCPTSSSVEILIMWDPNHIVTLLLWVYDSVLRLQCLYLSHIYGQLCWCALHHRSQINRWVVQL